MKDANRAVKVSTSVTLAIVLTFGLSFIPTATAQTGSLGQNATYYADQSCCQGTPSFADAYTYSQSLGWDICRTINFIFTHSYPSAGELIDARGLSGSALTCVGSPWVQGGVTTNVPSTILLPAGTITIPQTWVLPSKTHLIGQGDNIGAGTTIKANTSFSSPMIQFGSATGASEISVEDLVLDGQGQTITGILNQYAGDYTYVDHVGLYKILGTGLSISATDSGPYSNINFDIVVTGPVVQVKPGMNELQADFAIGMGVPEPGGPEVKTVNYPNGGKPVRVTYRNGKAAEIKGGAGG